MNRFRSLPALLGAALFAVAAVAAAAPDAAPPQGGKPPGPPPEALAACKGKAEGAAASFSGRNGETFSGTCQTTESGLAVRPVQGPPQQR